MTAVSRWTVTAVSGSDGCPGRVTVTTMAGGWLTVTVARRTQRLATVTQTGPGLSPGSVGGPTVAGAGARPGGGPSLPSVYVTLYTNTDTHMLVHTARTQVHTGTSGILYTWTRMDKLVCTSTY